VEGVKRGKEISVADHHAVLELVPIRGINLGFQNFVGFLRVGNSLREPPLFAAQESGGLLELANRLAEERSFWWILKKTVCYGYGIRHRFPPEVGFTPPIILLGFSSDCLFMGSNSIFGDPCTLSPLRDCLVTEN
jgi:hypothetical protein